MKRISDTELEIMNKLWSVPESLSARDVLDLFQEDNDWKINTVQTFLQRLVDKSYLEIVKKGRVNYYIPRVTKTEYAKYEAQRISQSVNFGSIGKFITALIDEDSLSEGEIDELKDWLAKK